MNGYISIREASLNGAFRNDGSTNTVLSGVFRGQNDSGVPGQFLLMQKKPSDPRKSQSKKHERGMM